MRIGAYQFGSVTIDGVTYHTDVVIDGGKVRKRQKQPSKVLREKFGHVPLSEGEEIPWDCRQLVIGTGAMGQLPITDKLREEAKRRRVKLVIAKTGEAVKMLKSKPASTNAILHLTC
jgi:hypothetical protein